MSEEKMMNMSTSEMYNELANINNWMSKAKAKAEMLRRLLKAKLEADMVIVTGKEGTQTVEFAIDGVAGKLKVDQKINRSLVQKSVPDVMKQLPPAVRAKVFKTKYELSIAGYRNLTPEQMAIVGPIVKESAGIPVVTFTPEVTDDEEV